MLRAEVKQSYERKEEMKGVVSQRSKLKKRKLGKRL